MALLVLLLVSLIGNDKFYEMKNYPRFSVIIPQRNRSEYLIHTLRTCMMQDYPNFEIIVGDDCSDDNSVELVRELQKKDSRIKLLAHEHHVGMRINFELALNEVKDGYVMALGGDDGLTPRAIWRMYEIIQKTGVELLTWSQARYKYCMDENDVGLFTVPRRKFNGVKMVKSSDYLNKISNTLNYMTDDCPMFYVKGVASIKLIDKVRSRTPDGKFYYCPTPDGFSGVVLAGEVESYAYTNEPITIAGDSPKSQGRIYHKTDEKSRKEAQQFFDDNARKTMHKELASQPYSPLITLMTADYLLTAKDLPGWPGDFKSFSINHLIQRTFKFLARSRFEPGVLQRELRILREIAIQHGELDLFNQLAKKTIIKKVKEETPKGFFVTRNIFGFNGTEMGINNIYDAALATKFAYDAYNMFSFKFFIDWFKVSWKEYKKKYNYQKEKLPII